jgi:hypothetical protein
VVPVQVRIGSSRHHSSIGRVRQRWSTGPSTGFDVQDRGAVKRLEVPDRDPVPSIRVTSSASKSPPATRGGTARQVEDGPPGAITCES